MQEQAFDRNLLVNILLGYAQELNNDYLTNNVALCFFFPRYTFSVASKKKLVTYLVVVQVRERKKKTFLSSFFAFGKKSKDNRNAQSFKEGGKSVTQM